MTNMNPMATALRYAEAKSRQDIDAALACCTGDFILEAPAAGTCAHDEEEARQQLAGLFHVLPDYTFITEGSALGEHGEVVLWGRFRGTSHDMCLRVAQAWEAAAGGPVRAIVILGRSTP